MQNFRALFSALLCTIIFLPCNLLSAANKERYKKIAPYFYAALAEATYKENKTKSQKMLDKLLKNEKEKATVIGRKVHKSKAFGRTNFLLVKDNHGNMHVGIEGTSEGRNWIGNAYMPARGTTTEYDVPGKIRAAMHNIIKQWRQEKRLPLASIVGHSQGGMYASQVAHHHDKHYKNAGTTIITFNAYKPKKKSNQLHFKVKNEHASTLCSPSRRYIPITKSSGHWSLVSNHRMKYFLQGLKSKNWHDVR